MSYYRHPPHRPSYGAIGFPPVTPMIRAIMIACGVVWGVQLFWGLLTGTSLAPVFGLVPERVIRGWIWQPVTYMWLHSERDPFHLIFNMLFLWMLGGDLERRWGSNAFLRYYLVCGIGAAAFITAAGLLQRPYSVTLGASGAIFGLILAFGTVFAERTILFMLIFPMKARTFAWVMFGVAFFFTWSQSGSPVSHIAHLGGMVVGWVYLNRAWEVGRVARDLRWRLRRRRFKVLPPKDDDWLH